MTAFFRFLAQSYGDAISSSITHSKPNATAIGLLAVVGFPLFYFFWKFWIPQPYENLTIRLFLMLWSIPLLTLKSWPQKPKWPQKLYWMSCLIMIPAFFQFMFFANGLNQMWALTVMAGIFMLVLIANDILVIVTAYSVGTAIALLSVWLMPDFDLNLVETVEMSLVFLFSLIGASIFSHQSERARQQRMAAMEMVGSSIAHEMRTPLLGLSSGLRGLGQFFPILVDAYRKAKVQGLDVQPLRDAQLEKVEAALNRLEQETNDAFVIVDMILMASRTQLDTRSFERISVVQVVQKALDRYPYRSPRERASVELKIDEDFYFFGSDLLMMHVLFNLLKNALFVVASTNGHVTILVQRAGQFGEVVVMDTGPGISLARQRRIFDRFYTSHRAGEGTGIGLAFCRDVMRSFGGEIECESKLHEYTKFRLRLPLASSLDFAQHD